MKLYIMPGACSFVPHTALEWTGADYDLEILTHDELKTDEFLRINPQGSVPAIKDGDTIVTQNIAVQSYINALYPEAKIFGDYNSPAEIAEIMHWLAFLNSDVHKGFAPLFSPDSFVEGDEAQANLKQHTHKSLIDLFKLPNKHLEEQDYLIGTKSTADLYLYVTLRWAKKFAVDLSGFNHLNDFIKCIEDDTGVTEALRQEGLDKIESLF